MLFLETATILGIWGPALPSVPREEGLPEAGTPSGWFPQLDDSLLPAWPTEPASCDFGLVDTSSGVGEGRGGGLPPCWNFEDSASLWPCFFQSPGSVVGGLGRPREDRVDSVFSILEVSLLFPNQGQARHAGRRGLERAASLPFPVLGAAGTQWKLKEAPCRRRVGLPPQGGARHPFLSGRCPGEPSLGAGSSLAPVGGCVLALAVAFATLLGAKTAHSPGGN